ncbi:galactose mutarotase [Enterococcus sp. JM4C]|nr:aldose epimerase family protein [Enterococcus sp. JM4C]KAF1298338.1 galactose mutarotase [Enterococcus sp. JM4C]
MKISQQSFGEKAGLFILENDNGYKLEVTDFGARVVNFKVPTKNGEKNIVLGFDSAEEYLEKDTYIGATIGRVAGRISKGFFTIDGTNYQVETQPEHGNTLHGGPHSFEEVYWAAETAIDEQGVHVTFSYTSPDGEKGFPGELAVSVTYTLNNANEWRLNYQAKTTKATLFNPTNHVYFNLTGDVTQATDTHKLQVAADKFVVVGDDTTATGEIRSVAGTPFDFQKAQEMTQAYAADYQQNVLVGGLDHPFVLSADAKAPQATISSPDDSIKVEMTTTEPSVVIFTAQFGEKAPIMRGEKLAQHGGITLETQVMPGAIEFEGFGDIVLQPTETFTSETVYKVIAE